MQNNLKKKPEWMNKPGAPEKPSFDDFQKKSQDIIAKRNALIEESKKLILTLPESSKERIQAIQEEKRKLQKRLNSIHECKKQIFDQKKKILSERQNSQSKRRNIENILREYTNKLGSLSTIEDINYAIQRVELSMETGLGGLQGEKKLMKKIEQLEKAREMINEVNRLQEDLTIAESEETERESEYNYICNRLNTINVQMAHISSEKKQVDTTNQKTAEEQKKIQEKPQKVTN